MSRKPLNIIPPLGGFENKTALNHKPPYTTPKCQNVWPKDVFNRQEKPGRRPGLDLWNGTELGSGNPVYMLSSVDIIKSDNLTFWTDNFNGASMDSVWTQASWADALPSITNDGVISDYNNHVGAVRDAFSSLDATSAFLIEMYISPYNAGHQGRYRLYAYLDDTTPDLDDEGVMAELIMEDGTGAYSGRLVDVLGSGADITNFTSGNNGYPASGIFSMLITTTNVKCYWRGTELCDVTVSSHSGSRMGFGMYVTQANGVCLVPWFRVQYYDSNDRTIPRKVLCASANGDLYRETYIDTLSALSSNLSLSDSENIMAVDRLQKLYIADHDEPVTSQVDGVTSGTSLDSASVPDWTTLDMNIYDYVVYIDSGSSATQGVYTISDIASGNLTLGSAPGNSSSVEFTIYRAPKIYDPKADTLTLWTADSGKGYVPPNVDKVVNYRDRMVVADRDGHVWYMSRQGDPLDWDYGVAATDAQRAVAGTNSEAGRVGARIRAMIAHQDDYLLFLCDTAFWRLRGDPTYGGQIDAISQDIGIVDKTAHCMTPNNTVYWLSLDGLYKLDSIINSIPQSVSREKLPKELINVDSKLYFVFLEYDIRFRGIHIYLTPKSGGQNKHWWYDFDFQSFWPMLIPENSQPTSTLAFVSQDISKSNVIFGCKDGYIRNFDEKNVRDGSTAISDYLYIGPINGWDKYYSGQVDEIAGVLPIGSGEIDWTLIVGNSHDQCLNNGTEMYSGTWDLEGYNILVTPKIRANSFIIKLESGEANKPWAIDHIACVLQKAGIKKYIT